MNLHRVESYGARLLIEEEVFALRSRELRKLRAAIDNSIVQLVGKRDLAEERTTKAPTAVVKVQLQLRLGPPSQ